jgi:hypothetical protein
MVMVWFGVFWLGLAPSLLESLVLGLDSGEPVPQRTHFSLQHTVSVSVADLDPNSDTSSDPNVFGPPGSRSTKQK